MSNPSMCSAEDSPARISVSPAKVPVLPERVRVFGQSTPVWLASFDPGTSLWKTSQLCLDGGLAPFSETWPRSGSMQSGRAFGHPSSGRHMNGTGSGLWPTPRASMGSHGVCWARAKTGDHRWQLEDFLASLVLQAGGRAVSGALPNHHLICWMMGFPEGWVD